MLQHFFYSNESVFCILIASVFLFLLILLIKYKRNQHIFGKIIFSLLLLGFGYVLLSTNGRAGWLGSIAGFFFLNKRLLLIPKLSRLKGFDFFFIILLFTIFLFLLKKDSSQGRIFIYKISANIFKDNWLLGIGLGNFKVQYNLHQAKYFSANNIDSKEALLADNTFYAFNDTWQLLIEIGTLRFLLLSILVFLLFKIIKKYCVKKGSERLFYGASAGLICMFTASLFSYPFQVFGLQLLSLIFLTILFFSLEGHHQVFPKMDLVLKSFRGISLIAIAGLCYFGYNKFLLFKKSKQAFDLSQSGYKKEALHTYTVLNQSNIKSGPVTYSYAKQLYHMNKLPDAKKTIEKAKHLYTDNDVYKLSAAIEFETGNLQEAEKDYLTAVYMVPNRMRSRYELLNFYLSINDTVNARAWAKSILEMPVKIPSEVTERLQNQTRNSLRKISSKTIY